MTTLLAQTIGAASGPNTTIPVPFPPGPYQEAPQKLTAQGNFVAGGGGSTVTAFLQTSLDGGVTWIDIASFAFTTSSLREIFSLTTATAAIAPVTPTDGGLVANTAVSGILGNLLRVKWSSTGNYASVAGTITFVSNPTANATVTIDGTVVTFVAGNAVGNQVAIGGTLAATLTALAAS